MSMYYKKYTQYQNRILIIGFGSIGRAVLPLIFRHLDITPSQITILSKDGDSLGIAQEFGVYVQNKIIARENYQQIIGNQLQSGDFLLNLSVDVSSYDLIELCQKKGALYLDTCTEPWQGGYVDRSLPNALRTNYALREAALTLKKAKGSTAVITHGANPGLISHFLKKALLKVAEDTELVVKTPQTPFEWAHLANLLEIKSIQIAEHDTQISNTKKRPGEFVNTWSVDGFVAEGEQPAELGWGTHERYWPSSGNEHTFGSRCAIYLDHQGASLKVRTWTPTMGPANGFLITHAESISIANYLTLTIEEDVYYRPTVHYAYVPCPDAVLSLNELAHNNWHKQENKRILFDEIVDGIDELGILLLGNKKGGFWYGSQLSIHEARKCAPFNNATSMQVAVGVLSGMIWAMEHPDRGLVEPEDIDYQYILNIAYPYLGNVAGYYTNWNPLQNTIGIPQTKLDYNDPWQFRNILVND